MKRVPTMDRNRRNPSYLLAVYFSRNKNALARDELCGIFFLRARQTSTYISIICSFFVLLLNILEIRNFFRKAMLYFPFGARADLRGIANVSLAASFYRETKNSARVIFIILRSVPLLSHFIYLIFHTPPANSKYKSRN